jgi:hypothetical protein
MLLSRGVGGLGSLRPPARSWAHPPGVHDGAWGAAGSRAGAFTSCRSLRGEMGVFTSRRPAAFLSAPERSSRGLAGAAMGAATAGEPDGASLGATTRRTLTGRTTLVTRTIWTGRARSPASRAGDLWRPAAISRMGTVSAAAATPAAGASRRTASPSRSRAARAPRRVRSRAPNRVAHNACSSGRRPRSSSSKLRVNATPRPSQADTESPGDTRDHQSRTIAAETPPAMHLDRISTLIVSAIHAIPLVLSRWGVAERRPLRSRPP